MNKKRNITSKEELIKICKFYKGEEECPFDETSDKRYIWNYERVWVDLVLYNKPKSFELFLLEYSHAGLEDFSKDDGVPITLKAILFNRCLQHSDGMCSPEEFKEVYKRYRSS